MKETLYLYKVLENIVQNYEIIEEKYKNLFLRKVLTLSNGKIKKIIKLIVEWEKKIEDSKEKHYYKILIEENKFMEKFIAYNKTKKV